MAARGRALGEGDELDGDRIDGRRAPSEARKQNLPSRNHTVNKAHLARFARGSLLHRVPIDGIGKPIPLSVDDAAVRKFFYVPEDPEGNRDFAFEGWASKFEGAATAAVRSIVDDGVWPPGSETRMALAEWIALQNVRTPTRRAYSAKIAAVLIGQFQQEGALDRLEAKLAAVGWEFSNAERELLREEVESYDATAGQVSTGMHLDIIKASMAGVVPSLLARGWVLVRFDRHSLCTSDNPIGMAGEDFSPSWLPLGLTDTAYVTVAIDRYAALVLPLAPGDGQLDGEYAYANAINLATLWNADEVLFAHPDDDLATMLPPIPPRRPRPFPAEAEFLDFSEWPVDTLLGFIGSARKRAHQ